MKTFTPFIIGILLLTSLSMFAQSGMNIKSGGTVTVNGNLNITPCPLPAAPLGGIHVPTATQIIWNWNAESGATGYKWNTVNDYNSATDLGLATSKTEINLTCNTSYTRFAWAYNTCGNSSPTILIHNTTSCSPNCGQIIDTRDGKSYNTIIIGTQCWMAQSLNVGTKIDVTSNQTNNSIIEKYCYNNDENKCNTYGGLYQWNEAMQYSTTPGVQGICPSGWHLPTDVEWTTLTTFLGGEALAGGKMKSTTGWYNNGNGTNSSGFTALPGGIRYDGGYFGNLTYAAVFGSSSQYDVSTAWSWHIYYYLENAGRYTYWKADSFSARCVQD